MKEETEILGGVSPLKARQSSRGGRSAGRATSTASRRGGFAKSKGARGAGGDNVGGYNVNTRFSADKWQKPPSGGYFPARTSSAPNPRKPVANGKLPNNITNIIEGDDINTNLSNNPDYEWVPGTDDVYGTRKGNLPSYRQAWDDSSKWETMKDGSKKSKQYGTVHKSFKAFEKAAKEYNEKQGKGEGKEEKYLKEKGKKGYYKKISGGNQNVTINTGDKNIGGMPFTLKGNPMFRNFGIGGKPKNN